MHGSAATNSATAVELNTFLKYCKNIDTLIKGAKKIYVWVIDMQPDFIDQPFQDNTVFKKEEIPKQLEHPELDTPITENNTLKVRIGANSNKKVEQRPNSVWKNFLNKSPNKKDNKIDKGRFAVDEGYQCIKDIQFYIKLLKDEEKLQKVIFSRDVHTRNNDTIEEPNHCSFSVTGSTKGKIDGIGFPTHCVNGTAGCQLHPEIWKMVKTLKDKSMVVIKGCQHDVDSFGAVSYSCKNHPHTKMYTNSRQQNGCNTDCLGNNDLPGTGSYVLNNTGTLAQDTRNDPTVNNLTTIKNDTNNKVENVLDLQESERGVLHLVCGLAGDYCVRDTAINLKFKYPSHKVAIIADATRYPSLPDFVIDLTTTDKNRETIHNNFKKNLHLNSHTDMPSQLNNFFLTAPDTLLYTYSSNFFNNREGVLFTMAPNRKKNIKYINPTDNMVRPVRNPDYKYWCLARHMYLLGKQLKMCNDKKMDCYKKQRLGVREGNDISVLGLSSHSISSLVGKKGRRTRHRTREYSKVRKIRKRTRRRNQVKIENNHPF